MTLTLTFLWIIELFVLVTVCCWLLFIVRPCHFPPQSSFLLPSQVSVQYWLVTQCFLLLSPLPSLGPILTGYTILSPTIPPPKSQSNIDWLHNTFSYYLPSQVSVQYWLVTQCFLLLSPIPSLSPILTGDSMLSPTIPPPKSQSNIDWLHNTFSYYPFVHISVQYWLVTQYFLLLSFCPHLCPILTGDTILSPTILSSTSMSNIDWDTILSPTILSSTSQSSIDWWHNTFSYYPPSHISDCVEPQYLPKHVI